MRITDQEDSDEGYHAGPGTPEQLRLHQPAFDPNIHPDLLRKHAAHGHVPFFTAPYDSSGSSEPLSSPPQHEAMFQTVAPRDIMYQSDEPLNTESSEDEQAARQSQFPFGAPNDGHHPQPGSVTPMQTAHQPQHGQDISGQQNHHHHHFQQQVDQPVMQHAALTVRTRQLPPGQLPLPQFKTAAQKLQEQGQRAIEARRKKISQLRADEAFLERAADNTFKNRTDVNAVLDRMMAFDKKLSEESERNAPKRRGTRKNKKSTEAESGEVLSAAHLVNDLLFLAGL